MYIFSHPSWGILMGYKLSFIITVIRKGGNCKWIILFNRRCIRSTSKTRYYPAVECHTQYTPTYKNIWNLILIRITCLHPWRAHENQKTHQPVTVIRSQFSSGRAHRDSTYESHETRPLLSRCSDQTTNKCVYKLQVSN